MQLRAMLLSAGEKFVVKKIGDLARRARHEPDRSMRLFVDWLKEPRPLVRGNNFLNLIGLQAARTLKDRAAWHLRRFNEPDYIREQLKILQRDGLLVIQDFLPQNDFEDLERELAEIDTWPEERFTFHQLGENMVARQLSASFYGDELPAFMRLLQDNQFIYDLARSVPRRRPSYRPRVVLHKLYKPDPQKPAGEYNLDRVLHPDRHYPFVKAFFCLYDMTREAAPYTYVPGSHRINWERISYEYQLGAQAARYKKDVDRFDELTWALSRRLLERLGLQERPLVVPKNTLILTDNAGLHRRNDMISGTRLTANLDYKFFESIAHPLYPLLKRWGSGGW